MDLSGIRFSVRVLRTVRFRKRADNFLASCSVSKYSKFNYNGICKAPPPHALDGHHETLVFASISVLYRYVSKKLTILLPGVIF
jgi:hypothetical protein